MTTTPKSSAKHCLTQITRLRLAGLRQPKQGADEITLQNQLYVEKLAPHDPSAVQMAVDWWLDHEESWPAVAKLLAKVREIEAEHEQRRRLTGPGAPPENLLARIRRVTGLDATWVSHHHEAVSSLLSRHAAGTLADEELADVIGHIRRTGEAPRPTSISPQEPRKVPFELKRMVEQAHDDPSGRVGSP